MCFIRYLRLTFLLLIPFAVAASPEADSLRTLLPGASDTTRVSILNRLSVLHWYSDPKQARVYATEALEISTKLDHDIGVGAALRNLGVANDVMGNYDSALVWYEKALELARRKNDIISEAAVLNNIGLSNYNKGEVSLATEKYIQALEILEKLDQPVRLASVLNNLGLVYFKLNRKDKAVEYHRRAFEIREEMSDKHGMGASLHNIAFCFEELSLPDSAIGYYEKSLEIKRQINDLYGMGLTLNNIGGIYSDKSEYDKAVEYLSEAIAIRSRINDKTGLASTHYNLSLIYQRTGQYDRAVSEALIALDFAQETGAQVREYTIYGGLMQTYREMGNFEKALEYYEMYFNLKQNVFSLERSQQIADLQEKYEAERKEKEIAFLSHENELKTLQVERQRSRTRSIIFAMYGLLLLTGIVILLIYYRVRYKHRLQLEKERISQQQQGFRAVLEAEENERMRIARELHDGLGQILSTTKLQLYSIEESVAETSRENLNTSLSLIDEAVNEVRSISHNMMPAALIRLGLVPALNEMARKINLSNKIEVIIDTTLFNYRLELGAEIAIYRIVQEILNNALKHSDATRIIVKLERSEQSIHLSIEDNGIGLDTEKVGSSNGIGWLSINTRVSMLNGSISINSLKGSGTVVNVQLVA